MDCYELYDSNMPPSQVCMLNLWDELQILHKQKKQVWERKLTIIGFKVDLERMTIMLPHEWKEELIDKLNCFMFPVGKCRKCF
jgi:hypothetical protein